MVGGILLADDMVSVGEGPIESREEEENVYKGREVIRGINCLCFRFYTRMVNLCSPIFDHS